MSDVISFSRITEFFFSESVVLTKKEVLSKVHSLLYYICVGDLDAYQLVNKLINWSISFTLTSYFLINAQLG